VAELRADLSYLSFVTKALLPGEKSWRNHCLTAASRRFQHEAY